MRWTKAAVSILLSCERCFVCARMLGHSPHRRRAPAGREAARLCGTWLHKVADAPLQLRIAFSRPYVEIPATYLVPSGSHLTLGRKR